MNSSFRMSRTFAGAAMLTAALLHLGAMPCSAGVMTGATAYWNFDELAGTTAANSGTAGSTLNGTLGGASTFLAGLFGNALSLPGADADYVNVANEVVTDGQAAYAISVWFNPDDVKATGGRRQVFFESAPNYALSAGLAGASNVVQHHVQATSGHGMSTTFRPTQGQWHHLAITYAYDSDASQGASKIYVDGIEYPAAQITSLGVLAATESFRIGRHRSANGYSFDGLLDDMAIWDRTLTGYEANTIYRMGQAGLALSSDLAVHVKANNTDNLNLGSSWESGVAPDASSYLVFDGTFAQTGSLDTGSDLAVAGLRVIGGTDPINVTNTSANSLQVGALGIDMMTAQRDMAVANLRLGADQSWDIGSGRTLSVGSLSGDHAFAKNGPGTAVLTGEGASTGGATLASGTLQVGNNAALGTGAVTLNGGTLSSNSTAGRSLANNVTIGGNVTLGHGTNRGTLTFSGNVGLGGATRQITTASNAILSGTISDGGLTKAGGGAYGTLTLTGENTYAGGTTLTAGTLRVGSDSALGTGPVALNAGTLSAVGATARTLANDVSIGGNVDLGTAADSGALIFSGPVNLGGAARQITIASDVMVSGAVSNGGLTKAGGGTLSLSGENTYSGGTTIVGGTVAAVSQSALGTGDVTLAGGALHVERSTELANNVVLDALAGQNFIRGVLEAEYLVVGGGGGGAGRDIGGGGGAGGYRSSVLGELSGGNSSAETPLSVFTPETYAVVVGAGGDGGIDASGNRQGKKGGDSSLGDIVAEGGGGGNGWEVLGTSGGSGGGGDGITNKTGNPGVEGQGFAGGNGVGGTADYGGGGGGGAGQPGTGAAEGKKGGDGLASSITGSLVYRAGGGGGAGHRSSGEGELGQGGLGGGGSAGIAAGGNGVPNTGGGGGAARNTGAPGGQGGSGVVIVRYRGAPAATGGTITAGTGSAAGYTLHTFTDVGPDTLTFDPIDLTISGALSGSGGFTWDTPGTLTLTSANTHSGATRVTAGTVALGNAQAVENSTLTLAGGTVAFTASGASSYTLGGLAGSSSFDAGGNTLIVGGNNQSTAYSGNLTTAQLTKTGSGTLTLSGSNTLGGTTVASGALAALSAGAVGAGAVTLDGGALHVERSIEFTNQIVLAGSAEENVIRGAVAVDYLVVGGGGGGAGRDVAGGGGGGGVLSNLVTPDMAPLGLATGTYNVTVGDGGDGGINHTVSPDNGEASAFDSIVALGGGAGGPYNSPAGSGASGGGSGRESTPGTGIHGQGSDGGSGGGSSGSGGGGGGAGTPGGDGGTSGPAGSGGDGLAVDITGAEVYYGGGGGGTWHRNDSITTRPSGLGGLGGGGDGADSHEPSNPGEPNTGGGGGAARSDVTPYYVGGKGGSGIVIVRYLGDPLATGGAVTAGTGSAAGYTLHTFTDVGAHTLEFGAIDATISGALTGSGGFTWNTPGTLTLTGSNTYTGTTKITDGTLALQGSGSIADSATISIHSGATFDVTGTTGVYAIQSGQTLQGSGAIRGDLVMNAGSALAPGASPGILTYDGDLTLSGSSLLIDIWSGDGEGTGHDLIEFASGALTLADQPHITVDLAGFLPELGSSYTIISGFENDLTEGFDSTVLVENAPAQWWANNGFQIVYGSGSIALAFVPEPGTWIMLAMGLWGLLAAGRRRNRRSAA